MSKCKDCKFYSTVDAEPGQDFGWCHRMPPVLIPIGDGNVTSTFPTIKEDSWCGEFKDRDDGKNSVELAR